MLGQWYSITLCALPHLQRSAKHTHKHLLKHLSILEHGYYQLRTLSELHTDLDCKNVLSRQLHRHLIDSKSMQLGHSQPYPLFTRTVKGTVSRYPLPLGWCPQMDAAKRPSQPLFFHVPRKRPIRYQLHQYCISTSWLLFDANSYPGSKETSHVFSYCPFICINCQSTSRMPSRSPVC